MANTGSTAELNTGSRRYLRCDRHHAIGATTPVSTSHSDPKRALRPIEIMQIAGGGADHETTDGLLTTTADPTSNKTNSLPPTRSLTPFVVLAPVDEPVQ